MMFDIDTSRSYATEENLNKGLTKLALESIPHITVRNRQGRYTAIFPYSRLGDVPAIHVADAGFMVVN